MGCLCNNLDDLLKTCSCGCNVCTTTTVPTTTTTTCIGEPCDEIIDPKCIIYNGPEIPCWGIQTGDSAADILDIIISLLPCIITTTTSNEPNPDQLCATKWSTLNLNVTTYRNGDLIPEVTDPVAWETLTTGAWCSYNNNSANDAVYGKLYNWYAINDSRGLAPVGYHVASHLEWQVLIDCLGQGQIGTYLVAGGKMKETGTSHWLTPNTGATNTSGLTILPAGMRFFNGYFSYLTTYAYVWTSTEINTTDAWVCIFHHDDTLVLDANFGKKSAASVRCISDV